MRLADNRTLKWNDVVAEPKRRGRPATGPSPTAKTPTERVKALDAELIASGGRILGRVRLSADAAAALARLSQEYGSDRAAIEAALISQTKNERIQDQLRKDALLREQAQRDRRLRRRRCAQLLSAASDDCIPPPAK